MSQTSTELQAPSSSGGSGSIHIQHLRGADVFNGSEPSSRQQPEGENENNDENDETPTPAFSYPQQSRLKSSVIIATASSMVLMNSVLSGILTVGLPVIADDINLQDSLLLWPASVYGLTCGCTLLLSGSMADVLGSRSVYLAGCALLAVFTLGCGLARTGIQLIVFRAISGIAMSLCLPSAVSIVTTTFATGRRRNLAFACLGAAQPVGFSLGIVIGGVIIAALGWRYGYYIVTGVNVLALLVAVFQIPPDPRRKSQNPSNRLRTEIDWVGTLLVCTALALFSYCLSTMSMGLREIARPVNLTLLVVSVICLAAFVVWVHHRERKGLVAMIPPSLFKSDASTTSSSPSSSSRARNFSTICVSVFFTWAVFNGYQYFTTLYFQRVQHLTPLQASLRFIPMVVSGAATNIATGLLVHRVRADALCVGAAAISACAPLLMALSRPAWSYWVAAFVATTLVPISADTFFTVSNLVITATFPRATHGLAGGVFNTISQVGMSVGLAVNAVISAQVAAAAKRAGEGEAGAVDALLEGYRATYWTCFAASVVIAALSWWGLRSIGKIGVKTE